MQAGEQRLNLLGGGGEVTLAGASRAVRVFVVRGGNCIHGRVDGFGCGGDGGARTRARRVELSGTDVRFEDNVMLLKSGSTCEAILLDDFQFGHISNSTLHLPNQSERVI